MSEDAAGLCRLSVAKVQPRHAGNYTVTAVNEAGQAKLQASLVVRPPTPPPPAVPLEEPPVFTQIFGEKSLPVGQQLLLECQITGQPYPQVTLALLFALVSCHTLFNCFERNLNLREAFIHFLIEPLGFLLEFT